MTVGESERNVACTQTDVNAIFLLDQLNRLQRDQRRVAVVTYRHHQRIDDNVLGWDSHFRGALDDDASRNETSFGRGWNALFANGQADHRRAPVPDNGQHACELFLLPVDRVYQWLAR